MEFTTLTIEIPLLSGEQAAMMQQTLYAFLDAFDEYYAFAIERYHQGLSNQEHINNAQSNKLVQKLLNPDEPF
jgi:hypothetical protein